MRASTYPDTLSIRVPEGFGDVVADVAASEAMTVTAFVRSATVEALKKRGVRLPVRRQLAEPRAV